MTDAHSTRHASSNVLTVTVNPALDVSMEVERLVPDVKLRAHDWVREPGGGGVNVTRVLHRLAVPARAFVVAGGSVGAELLALLSKDGLDVAGFAILDGTRESVAITESSTTRQYRLSAPGPTITDADSLRLGIIDEAATAGIVILSGSLAPGLPTDFYAQVISELDPSTKTIVDCHGAPLAAVAALGATVLKPSQRELAELVGWEPITTDDIEQAAHEVLNQGEVKAVVASRGPTGALLATRDDAPVWFRPPPVHPVSTVGAGDSMVAGIAASLAKGHDLVEAVRFGVAAGTAAVLTPGSELCRTTDIESFVDQVVVTRSNRDLDV